MSWPPHSPATTKTEPWQVTGQVAQLTAGALRASVHGTQPWQGLTELVWDEVAIPGQVLGVLTAGCGPADPSGGYPTSAQQLPPAELEVFVRGADLVARYQQFSGQPFTCQIYWRIGQWRSAILVDTIISVHTELLETFPSIFLESCLPGREVWQISSTGQPTELPAETILDSDASSCAAGIVSRPPGAAWSYAEMVHPEDGGAWQIEKLPSVSAGPPGYAIRRRLGGEFLEKGVIRRLRVRGAFLPRQGDLALATDCWASLATAAPPLTA